MKFNVDTWTIKTLIERHERGEINLNPPYQRNDIWLKKMKQKLIDSIMHNYPMPAFFLHQTEEGKFDMVDGQQRTRAMLGFYKGAFSDLGGALITEEQKRVLEGYRLVMIIITEIAEGELIHDFYDRVNSLGLHLKRGETLKAKYRGTRFLALITSIAENELFQALQLFSDRALERLDDIDFVSELVALLEYGVTEKKKQTEEMFKGDIDEEKSRTLRTNFLSIIERIQFLDTIFRIQETRYCQRNDFYTLFQFVSSCGDISNDVLGHMYRLLVRIGSAISPSNEKCPALQDYAFDCVSQSNSAEARNRRFEFFQRLLLNPNGTPNDEQTQIMEHFRSSGTPLMKLPPYHIIDYRALRDPIEDAEENA